SSLGEGLKSMRECISVQLRISGLSKRCPAEVRGGGARGRTTAPPALLSLANLDEGFEIDVWRISVRVDERDRNGEVDILTGRLRARLAANSDPRSSCPRTSNPRHKQNLPLEAPAEPAQLRSGKVFRRRLIPR